MSIFSILLFILYVTSIQCQTVNVQFPSFSANTDVGSCTCDLTINICDPSCCCDPSCTQGDKTTFKCNSRSNQFTTVSPIYSTIQANCFKNNSIFKGDTPYVVEKAGELVCIDFARSSDSQYYEQPNANALDARTFVTSINSNDGLIATPQVPTGLTRYEIGTSILRSTTTNTITFFSLPIAYLANPLCSGSQIITYMNDFTSTCLRLVNAASCNTALNGATYQSLLCLIKNPSGTDAITCTSLTIPSSTTGTTDCTDALTSLAITINYLNPTGIISVTVASTTATVNFNQFVQQTFTVQFVRTTASSSTITRNPGYLAGATLRAATGNDTSLIAVTNGGFSLLQGTATGACDSTTTGRIPIRFGENTRSSCQYTITNAANCATATRNLLSSLSTAGIYVAAYADSDISKPTQDWLPVFSCVSVAGSSSTCSSGSLSVTTNFCFQRLDIQIEYVKIGTVINPQSILTGVVFHYQQLDADAGSSLFLGTSVTFTENVNTPVIEQGFIPAPDARLPADFFFPFSAAQPLKPLSFSILTSSTLFVIFGFYSDM